MRADYIESLPPAGILEREEIELRRYRGMNPSFVRRVWAKRRGKEAMTRNRASGRPSKWTDEKKARIAQMMQAGLSSGQIAVKFGESRAAIISVVNGCPKLKAIGFQTEYAKRLRENAR